MVQLARSLLLTYIARTYCLWCHTGRTGVGLGRMSTFVLRMLSIRRELAIELQRFILLWRYQHRVPPFALWWRLVIKRIVDVAGALAGLVLTAPLVPVVAAAIKLTSKGPIVYSQERGRPVRGAVQNSQIPAERGGAPARGP